MKASYDQINLNKINRVRCRENIGVFREGEIYPVKRRSGYFYIESKGFKMQAKAIKMNLFKRAMVALC